MRKFNVTTLMQFIKNLIALSYIKRILNIILPFLMSRLQCIARQGFGLRWTNEFGG
jgi:O-antigen ligase